MNLGGIFKKVVAGPANAVVHGVAYHLVGRWAAAAARGEYGPAAQAAYQACRGWKTVIGATLFVLAGGFAATGGTDAATLITGTAGSLLLAAGLIDKDFNKGLPGSLVAMRWYVWCKDHASWIGLAIEGGGRLVAACTADTAAALAYAHLTCEQASMGLTFVGGCAFVLGWTAKARLSDPPTQVAP